MENVYNDEKTIKTRLKTRIIGIITICICAIFIGLGLLFAILGISDEHEISILFYSLSILALFIGVAGVFIGIFIIYIGSHAKYLKYKYSDDEVEESGIIQK